MTAYGWAAHMAASIGTMILTFRTRRRPENEMKGENNYGKIS